MLSDEKLIEIYINQMTDVEKTIYNIAKEHLETSFDIEKSIGYLKWKNDYIKQ